MNEDAETEAHRRAVEKRAHEIYKARGGEHGRDVEDWEQAERELAAGARLDPSTADVDAGGGEIAAGGNIGEPPASPEQNESDPGNRGP